MNETMSDRIADGVKKYKLVLAQFSLKRLFSSINTARKTKQLSVLNYIFMTILIPLLLICWLFIMLFKTLSFLCSLAFLVSPILFPMLLGVLVFEILHTPFRLILTLCTMAILPKSMTEPTTQTPTLKKNDNDKIEIDYVTVFDKIYSQSYTRTPPHDDLVNAVFNEENFDDDEDNPYKQDKHCVNCGSIMKGWQILCNECKWNEEEENYDRRYKR